MEGLEVADTQLVVYLHPSTGNNVHKAILRELSSLLLRYNEIFEGVVLAYEFNILNKNTKILPGIHPYFSVQLKAKLLLFSPKPDMLVEGKVVKVKQESIHVIVLGFSSAVITDKDIRKEFQYKSKHGNEVFVSRSHKRHVIKAGNMIRLLVKSVDEDTLYISGSLLPAHTGNIIWLDKHMEDVSVMDGSNKRRGNEGESVMQEPTSRITAETVSVNNDHHNKSNKRRRGNERDSVIQEHSRTSAETFSVNNDHRIKKSKKLKTQEES